MLQAIVISTCFQNPYNFTMAHKNSISLKKIIIIIIYFSSDSNTYAYNHNWANWRTSGRIPIIYSPVNLNDCDRRRTVLSHSVRHPEGGSHLLSLLRRMKEMEVMVSLLCHRSNLDGQRPLKPLLPCSAIAIRLSGRKLIKKQKRRRIIRKKEKKNQLK